jgi:hypothetical protein
MHFNKTGLKPFINGTLHALIAPRLKCNMLPFVRKIKHLIFIFFIKKADSG